MTGSTEARSRPEMVGMRVTREEKRALQVLAEYQTEGNLAELLRSRVFPWANRALADRLTGYTER